MADDKTAPIMIQGLRPRRTGPYPWQRVMRDRLSHRFRHLKPSPSTEVCEAGFGYPPSAYWYVQRTEAAFGRVATVWSASGSVPSVDEAAATPFDTGGIWHDHILVDPTFSGAEDKIDFATSSARSLDAVEDSFHLWLRLAYPGEPKRYLRGDVPDTHVPRIVLDGARNQSRAWTWELRISTDRAVPTLIEPLAIYWDESDYEAFEAWLESYDDALSHRERATLIAVCRSISVFTPRPAGALMERLDAELTA